MLGIGPQGAQFHRTERQAVSRAHGPEHCNPYCLNVPPSSYHTALESLA